MSVCEEIKASRATSPPGTFHAIFAPRRSGKTFAIIDACKRLKADTQSAKIVIIVMNSAISKETMRRIHREQNLINVFCMTLKEFCCEITAGTPISADYAIFDSFSYEELSSVVAHKLQLGTSNDFEMVYIRGDAVDDVRFLRSLRLFIEKTTVWGFIGDIEAHGSAYETIESIATRRSDDRTLPYIFSHISVYGFCAKPDGSSTLLKSALSTPVAIKNLGADAAVYIDKCIASMAGLIRNAY